MAQNQNLPKFNFTFDDSVAEWNVCHRTWLATNEKSWDCLATGALVFDSSNRILLLQRAPDDSMPNKWEIPGGACDDEDPSVLYGCARELWEEAGLEARHIQAVMPDNEGGKPGSVFTNRTGKRFYCKFSFEVEVGEAEVKLDSKEHQDYCWATEADVELQMIGTKSVPLTGPMMLRTVRNGFRMRRERLTGMTRDPGATSIKE